jgi:23S rRNA pseudouridine1911/1915/1917 synthase
MTKFEFQVTEAEHKMRLEDFLLEKFRTLSKMYLRELVRDEQCEVNGRFENRGFVLRTNDYIEIEIDNSRRTAIHPEPIPLEIVFEDREILVINKPLGMLVHPTLKVRTGTLLNALAFYLNSEEEKRRRGEEEKKGDKNIDEIALAQKTTNDSSKISSSPLLPFSSSVFTRAGLIHRLDKDTSGLIVISKNARAHRILCSHFQRKLIEKRYFALVDGLVKDDAGTIDAPIGRFEEEKIWNIKTDGKRAISNFWVKERYADSTLLELEPVTGRTNQLRIHLAHIGHPIKGDEKYGGRFFKRMCLHAYRLCFWHPNGGKWLEFESKLEKQFD